MEVVAPIEFAQDLFQKFSTTAADIWIMSGFSACMPIIALVLTITYQWQNFREVILGNHFFRSMLKIRFLSEAVCPERTFWMKMLSPVCAAALFLCIVATSLESSWCYPSSSSPVNLRSKRSIDNENPEDIVRILMKLAQDVIDSDSLMHTSDKRGIDLGLSRGFSEAKQPNT
ncbi:hypothetical protein CEXT_384701 [Caerostris extrusa]|uniref:Uncharacterized protein n=1 Tax=Caerostris extrusa TaxID=172846 RepID=A0AAV4RVL9_CAEEX|nr:hypothetical protein CEXT_384701 [Caerostris extrusa]